jgi:LysM repeat protein
VPHYITIPNQTGEECQTCTVQSGDTCGTISKQKNISLHDFLCANPELSCRTLQVGQIVNIPPYPLPFPPEPPQDGPYFKYIN